MKVKKIGIIEILRRIRLFSANNIKSSESGSKQPTQLIITAHYCHIGILISGNPKCIPFLNFSTTSKRYSSISLCTLAELDSENSVTFTRFST